MYLLGSGINRDLESQAERQISRGRTQLLMVIATCDVTQSKVCTAIAETHACECENWKRWCFTLRNTFDPDSSSMCWGLESVVRTELDPTHKSIQRRQTNLIYEIQETRRTLSGQEKNSESSIRNGEVGQKRQEQDLGEQSCNNQT